MAIPPAAPSVQPSEPQVIEIVVDGGYRPNTVVVRAGRPLRILVRRVDADPCTERIVFSSPHLERRLVRGEVATVDLPARPAGEVRFTCGMGRYRGRVIVVDSDLRWLLERVRSAIAVWPWGRIAYEPHPHHERHNPATPGGAA